MYAHHSIIYNSQYLKTTQASNDRWIDKEIVLYIHIGYYLAIRKALEEVMLSEVSQNQIFLRQTPDYLTHLAFTRKELYNSQYKRKQKNKSIWFSANIV